MPDRHSLKLALKKKKVVTSVYVGCLWSVERKQRNVFFQKSATANSCFPFSYFCFFLKKKRREAECVYMGIRRGAERKEGVSQEERKRQVFFLRFIRKNILLSDNAK